MRTPRNGRITLTLLALAIFAATTVAHAQSFSVLHNFGTKGVKPCSFLALVGDIL
jgi:hypothetical protein